MTKSNNNHKIYRFKMAFIGLIFFFFFCAIIMRAYQLQVLDNSKLKNLASSQYKTEIIFRPKRGAIYDRNGEVLALDILVSSVGIHPHKIDSLEKEKLEKILLQHTDIKLNQLEEKFASKRKFEWIQRRIPRSVGEILEKEKFKGVQVIQEFRRFYPNKELAGQVLGAVGYDAKALGGAELSFDKYLKSNTKIKNVERDARGKFFSPLNDKESNHNIYLTIDKNIQYAAEETLQEYAKKHNVKSGFAIVADANSGEILAMANYPRFNPNLYWKYSQSYWRNNALINVYEPGSTFKTVLMAAALESGKVKSTDRFFCENGHYKINNYVVNDHIGYGWLDAHTILKVSSNIGVTKIAKKIGKKTFYDFIQALGFGRTTNIGLVGELPGMIRPYKTWRDIEHSNIAFGQGLSVSGLQMIQAYTAIASGGHLFKPTLLKKVVSSSGNVVFDNQPKEVLQVMHEYTIKELKSMLYDVTQQGGTAIQADIEGYLAGGKTGTAQKFDQEKKTYASHDYISSFIGFTPLEKPQFVVYVVYDTPRTNGYYGGIVAAPAFKKISTAALQYYGVAPTQPIAKKEEKLAKIDDEVSIEAIHQKKLQDVLESLKNKTVPDFTGFSLRKVLEIMEEYSVNFDVEGSGVVIKQWPKPGSKLNTNKDWKLELARRS